MTGEESPTGVNASCSPIIKHKDGRLNLNYRQVCSRILCGEKDPLWNTRAAFGMLARFARPVSFTFLGLPNDKILSCRFNHFFGHCRQDVDFENPLDLRQEPVQQPEVAASDSDDRSGDD